MGHSPVLSGIFFLVDHPNKSAKGLQMQKIEIYANKTDRALLKAALNDLLDKIMLENDFYGVGKNVNDLINQLQEITEE